MAWSQTHRLPQERDRTQTPPKHQDKGLLPKHSLSGNREEGNYERVRETDNQETWDPRQEAALGVTLQTGFRGLVRGVGQEDRMKLGWLEIQTWRWAVGHHGRISAVEQDPPICILEDPGTRGMDWVWAKLAITAVLGRNNGAPNYGIGRWGRGRWAIWGFIWKADASEDRWLPGS